MLARPGISELVKNVVRKVFRPNPVCLAFTEGYVLSFDGADQFQQVTVPAALAPGFESAMMFPVSTSLKTKFGEEPICVTSFTVVPPLPPFHVCGGIVLIEARPNKESDRWFRMRLVGARLGKGPALRAPAKHENVEQ
jgi:hypothetical protein